MDRSTPGAAQARCAKLPLTLIAMLTPAELAVHYRVIPF